MLTDEEMPILVDIQLKVKGVRRVDVNTYTELQTGTETPDYTVRKCSVSCTVPVSLDYFYRPHTKYGGR